MIIKWSFNRQHDHAKAKWQKRGLAGLRWKTNTSCLFPIINRDCTIPSITIIIIMTIAIIIIIIIIIFAAMTIIISVAGHNHFVRHCPQNCHHLKERCCHPTHHLVTFTGADWSPQLKQSSGEISWSLLDQLQCDTSWVGSSDIDFRYKIQCRIQQYWNWKQNYLFCLNSNFQYKNGISEIPKLFFTHTVQFWVLLLITSGVDSLVRVLNFWLNQKFEWEDAPSRIPRSINFVFGVASHEIVN